MTTSTPSAAHEAATPVSSTTHRPAPPTRRDTPHPQRDRQLRRRSAIKTATVTILATLFATGMQAAELALGSSAPLILLVTTAAATIVFAATTEWLVPAFLRRRARRNPSPCRTFRYATTSGPGRGTS
jgi:hypothetical protein